MGKKPILGMQFYLFITHFKSFYLLVSLVRIETKKSSVP